MKKINVYANSYGYGKKFFDLEIENKQLKDKLECSQTNEETYRLEMEEITKILGLKENELFDVVKKYVNNLHQENEQLKDRINKAIEYIEDNGHHYDIDGDGFYDLGEEEQMKLLEILKGDK